MISKLDSDFVKVDVYDSRVRFYSSELFVSFVMCPFRLYLEYPYDELLNEYELIISIFCESLARQVDMIHYCASQNDMCSIVPGLFVSNNA